MTEHQGSFSSRGTAAFDHDVVRHAYEAALDRVTRLTAYAHATELPQAPGYIAERAVKLAIDDLISAAISLRRLIEACQLDAKSQNVHVSLAEVDTTQCSERGVRKGSTSVWALLGIIVHSRLIEIVDSRIALVLRLRGVDGALDRLHEQPTRIEPLCLVKSDRRGLIFFVGDFALRCGELLEIAEEVCSDNRLHLHLD